MRKLSDLNTHLFAQLDRLSAQGLTADQIDQEVKRAIPIPIAPQPTPIVDGSGPGPHYVADMMSQFVASVWHLLDNSETSGPIDDPITTVMQSDFDEVSKWLDRLEALPSGSTSHLSVAELVATYLAPLPVEVMVKPLVWDGHVAHTAFGSYAVHDCRGYGQTYRLRLPTGVEGHTVLDHGSELMFTTQELAKAAAQANKDAVIRAETTIQPADPLSDPRVVALVEAAKAFMHDVDDLIANSEGVSGLHMNGDVADWESLLPGGMFGAWLVSIDEFRAAIRAIGGEA